MSRPAPRQSRQEDTSSPIQEAQPSLGTYMGFNLTDAPAMSLACSRLEGDLDSWECSLLDSESFGQVRPAPILSELFVGVGHQGVADTDWIRLAFSPGYKHLSIGGSWLTANCAFRHKCIPTGASSSGRYFTVPVGHPPSVRIMPLQPPFPAKPVPHQAGTFHYPLDQPHHFR